MAPTGISLNKPVAVGIGVLVAGAIIFYHWGWMVSPFSSSSETELLTGDKTVINFNKLEKEIDVKYLPTAQGVGDKKIEVKEMTINVEVGGKTLKIFSRQTSPEGSAKLTVLLLHGQAFTSKNWEDINTLRLLAAWGYKAVAVDLPGYGNTKDILTESGKEEEFMKALVKELVKTSVVIISPSMSGRFSMPYLFKDPKLSTERAVGFVPVAPVNTDMFKTNYPGIQLPTLVVYGADDQSLGKRSREDLKNLPHSQIVVIPEAGHACYINQPVYFHNALYSFLGSLKNDKH